MRQRLEVSADGTLRDGNGQVWGRLVSLTVEVTPEGKRGGRGGDEIPSRSTTSAVEGSDSQQRMEISSNADENTNPIGGVGENLNEVEEVWAHYQRVVETGKRYTLERKRRQMIRNALKVRSKEQILRAIDWLAVSPHHNGRNEQRKKYLGIQYAIKGTGDEGIDERIDKMAAQADRSRSDPLVNVPSAGREMVRTRQRQVEDMLMHPGDQNRRARGEGSLRYLREQFGLVAHISNGVVTWKRATGVPS